MNVYYVFYQLGLYDHLYDHLYDRLYDRLYDCLYECLVDCVKRRFEAHDVKRSVQVFGMSWYDSAYVNQNSKNPTPYVSTSNFQGFQFYDTWVQ